jgi:hypothetical protein
MEKLIKSFKDLKGPILSDKVITNLFKNKYYGSLETYFETGFESMAIIVHDYRGLSRGPSFNNESRKWDGPEQNFKTLKWAIFLKGINYIRVMRGDGSVEWEGFISDSLEKRKKDGFRSGFLPAEVENDVWKRWTSKEVKVELFTNDLVMVHDPKYQEFIKGE